MVIIVLITIAIIIKAIADFILARDTRPILKLAFVAPDLMLPIDNPRVCFDLARLHPKVHVTHRVTVEDLLTRFLGDDLPDAVGIVAPLRLARVPVRIADVDDGLHPPKLIALKALWAVPVLGLTTRHRLPETHRL